MGGAVVVVEGEVKERAGVRAKFTSSSWRTHGAMENGRRQLNANTMRSFNFGRQHMTLMNRYLRCDKEKGQSLVEMALVSLLFFFLLFGILEFGRALWTYNTIVNGTRAGARWGVVNIANDSDNTNKDRVRNIILYGYPNVTSGSTLVPGLTAGMINVNIVTLDTDSGGATINQKVSVSVSGYQFRFLIPLAPVLTIPAYETSLYTESMGATS